MKQFEEMIEKSYAKCQGKLVTKEVASPMTIMPAPFKNPYA